MTVTELSWPALNDALLECEDEATLRSWLTATLRQGGPPYRALRIHGRLSAVRRVRELKEIREQCKGRAA